MCSGGLIQIKSINHVITEKVVYDIYFCHDGNYKDKKNVDEKFLFVASCQTLFILVLIAIGSEEVSKDSSLKEFCLIDAN